VHAVPDEERRSSIEAELQRIEEAAIHSSQAQFSQAKIWRTVNLSLGIMASGLAAASGGAILASAIGRTEAGLVALGSAVVGAVLTSVNANRRAEQAHLSANAYLSLQSDCRILRTVDLPALDIETARGQLAELAARRDEVNRTTEIPLGIAFWLGKLNIRRGGTEYAVDKHKGK